VDSPVHRLGRGHAHGVGAVSGGGAAGAEAEGEMSVYYAQKIIPCECGSPEPYWHGQPELMRVYCCDACWKQARESIEEWERLHAERVAVRLSRRTQ